jgi:hypothetical protein
LSKVSVYFIVFLASDIIHVWFIISALKLTVFVSHSVPWFLMFQDFWLVEGCQRLVLIGQNTWYVLRLFATGCVSFHGMSSTVEYYSPTSLNICLWYDGREMNIALFKLNVLHFGTFIGHEILTDWMVIDTSKLQR